MKTWHWVLGGLALVMLMLAGGYNGLVSKDVAVAARLGEIQVQEQRRGDLVPQLVETVRGYAAHEKGVFEAVTKARAEVGKLSIDPSKLAGDPALMKQFMEASQTFSGSLSRLIAVSEAYPQLKANEGFLTLQKQLEGNENRIAVARRNFVLAIQDYNTAIRGFPAVLYAGMLGFTKKPEFEAPAASREVPKVKFN
ncbi:MAG: LemA family protein [Patescibacteria group bacterium]